MRFRTRNTSTTPIPILGKFCWYRRALSAVRTTSKPASTAARRRTPFRSPNHRCARTVETSWFFSSRASAIGSDSSTRTLTTDDRLLRQLERGNRLVSCDGWELLEKLLQRIPCLEVVEQVVDRNSCSDENEFASHDLGITVDHVFFREHDEILTRRGDTLAFRISTAVKGLGGACGPGDQGYPMAGRSPLHP